MPGLDNPRTLPRVVVAVNWQAAEGTAAGVPGAQILHAESASIDPQVEHVMPMGTTGSKFQKDTHVKVSETPVATINVFWSRHQAPVFWESLMMGAPQVIDANLTESGDGSAELDTWTLNGVRPGFNTDDVGLGQIHASIDANFPSATDTTVNLYSDSARLNLVATGVIVDGAVPGLLTLAEANNSGLSGTVNVASIPGSDNILITLDINQIVYTDGLQWTEFFTLWIDDGVNAERITDCVVTTLKLSGSDGSPLMAEISIAARAHDDIVGGLFTVGLEDRNIWMYSQMVIRSDVDGAPVREFPGSIELEYRNRLTTVLGSDVDPQKIIAEGVEEIRGNLVIRPSDGEDLLYQQGLTDANDSWDFISTLGSDIQTIVLDRVKVVEPKRRDIEAEQLADSTIEFIALERQDASVRPFTVSIQG